MLDALTRVIDRLIQLRAYQGERQRRIFSEFAQPLFDDLGTVHTNYRAMLDSARNILEPSLSTEPLVAIDSAIGYLTKARRELEPLRRELLAHSAEVDNFRTRTPHGIASFVGAMQYYLVPASSYRQYSVMTDLLERLDRHKRGGDVEAAHYFVVSLQGEVDDAWELVCRAFAAARVHAQLAD